MDTEEQRCVSSSTNFLKLGSNLRSIWTWEKLSIFPRREQQGPVSRFVMGKKTGNLNEDIVGCFPELEELLSSFRKRCLAKKTAFKSKEIMLSKDQGIIEKIEVYRRLRRWILKFLPPRLLGSHRNTNRYLRNLTNILGHGKSCGIRLSSVLAGISIHDVPWLHTDTNSFIPVKLKFKMFAKFIKWLSENVVWRLLKSFFHVTDTSYSKQAKIFFRKRSFQALFDSELQRLCDKKLLRKLKPDKDLPKIQKHAEAPDIAQVRLMPKTEGCRIIGTRKRSNKKSTSNNGITDAEKKPQSFLRLLVFIKNWMYSESIDVKGAALYDLWSDFYQKCNGKKLYYVQTDIKDAFDSINLKLLQQILCNIREHFPTDVFLHEIWYKKANESKTIYKQEIQLSDDNANLRLGDIKILQKNVVRIKVDEALSEIAKRTRLQVVSLKKGLSNYMFLRLNGLLQGDLLSGALCDIYLGDLVQKELLPQLEKNYESGAERLFVRAVDDFFFVTTSLSEAQMFHKIILNGFPTYNCFVQVAKTRSNIFEDPREKNEVQFCGMILNVENREVRPDFSRIFNQSIVHSMTFSRTEDAMDEKFILKKMLFVCKLKLDPLFVDLTFNSWQNVLKNLFELFYLTALRLDSLVQSLFFFDGKTLPVDFVGSVARKCYLKVCRRLNKLTEMTSVNFQLSSQRKMEIRWLHNMAYLIVIKKRAAQYGSYCVKKFKRMCQISQASVQVKEILSVIRERNLCSVKSNGFQKLKC